MGDMLPPSSPSLSLTKPSRPAQRSEDATGQDALFAASRLIDTLFLRSQPIPSVQGGRAGFSSPLGYSVSVTPGAMPDGGQIGVLTWLLLSGASTTTSPSPWWVTTQLPLLEGGRYC